MYHNKKAGIKCSEVFCFHPESHIYIAFKENNTALATYSVCHDVLSLE